MNYPKPLKIGLVLLLLTILFINFGYAEECANCAQTPSMTGLDYQLYPIMHLSPEQIEERVSDYASQPQITAANFPRRPTGAPTSHDNLPLLTYVTNDRDQGNCGNCWVWASTAVMEIALRNQNGISDRESIQYFNSRYNGGTGVNYACCGGWPSQVDTFYSTAGQEFAVDWDNPLAHPFADTGLANDCGDSTSVPWGTITTTPNYPITSITTQTITTTGVTTAQAITNIEAVIDSNKGVIFSFFLPTGDSWNNPNPAIGFQFFWGLNAETSVYQMDQFDGVAWDGDCSDGQCGGGHSVTIVGYDDSDANPANHYWVCLNSWGDGWTGNRPNGLFRIPQQINYATSNPGGGQAFFFETFTMTYAPVNQPPVAGFSGAPYCGQTGTAISFSGAGSSDPDPGDSIAAYEWDWGDGTGLGSGVTPSHTYAAANYGLRTVQLRVQDTHGAWSGWVATAVPVNARPVAGFTGAPYSGSIGVPITFDGSASTDAYGGPPLEYQWDWENDGWDGGWLATATTTHTYTTPGPHTVALRVRDQFQCPAGTWARWNSAKVTTTVNVINHPPVAEANGPYTVNDGQAVAFLSTDSGDPDVGDSITYAWDFMNDGGAPDSTAPNPSYTYPTWGTYTARLTVTDSFGLTATDTASVTVRAYPIANAGPDQFMLVGETVSFNGGASTDPDGTIVAYDWNFGDGSAHGTGVTTTHLYAVTGAYTVTLTVTDNDGLTDTDTAVITYMTSCDGINYLKTVVNGMTIKASVKTGLNSKLTNANTLCVNGQKASAIKTMNNFITQCNTQRGRALTNTQADTLVNWANRIIAALRRM